MLSGPWPNQGVKAAIGKRILLGLLGVITIAGIAILKEGLRIREAVAAACRKAQPLVDRRASRGEVVSVLGPGFLPAQDGRLIYSTSEYIMYISFDSSNVAVKAECVNQ